MLKTGRVILVGAGPGDPELLTLKGQRWLAAADVVLYDFLVHPNLLLHCRPEAELICVGKRKGHHVHTQEKINELMIEKARAGHLVVRLKGGDPVVFGRGGEELLELAEAGIPAEVVSGVSSGWAAPISAGIPLTFRDMARSVAFVSGSLSSGRAPDQSELPIADTVVVFMPITHIDAIADSYLKHGRFTADTPAAVIYRGTLARQQTLAAPLAKIGQMVREAEVSSPALLVIGQVVGLSPVLNWTHHWPLFGQRVVILRSAHQSETLARRLTELGAEAVVAPMLRFQTKDDQLKLLSSDFLAGFSTIIFTSPNGVRHFMDSILGRGMDARELMGKQLGAIGPKTAQTLRDYGLSADFQAIKYHSDGLLDALPQQLDGQSILLPVAEGAADELPESLTQRGAVVTVLKTYETLAPDMISLNLTPGDWVIFTSSSTATHFFESVWQGETTIRCVSIGPKTTDAIRNWWSGDIIEAESATESSLVDAIQRAVLVQK